MPKGKTRGLYVSLFFQERASMQTPNRIRMVRNFIDVDTNIICLIRNILVVNPSFHLGQLNLLKFHIDTGPNEIKAVEFSWVQNYYLTQRLIFCTTSNVANLESEP